jgi:hypothetical protein
MAKLNFIQQLQALGYTVQEPATDFIAIDFEIPLGRFRGQKVTMALQVTEAFPMTPPPGPHFKPHLLPITGGGGSHPYGAIHTSPLGLEWQYWSRPFTAHWNNTAKTAKVYLTHINNLFIDLS